MVLVPKVLVDLITNVGPSKRFAVRHAIQFVTHESFRWHINFEHYPTIQQSSSYVLVIRFLDYLVVFTAKRIQIMNIAMTPQKIGEYELVDMDEARNELLKRLHW